jgi:hypothetical protein
VYVICDGAWVLFVPLQNRKAHLVSALGCVVVVCPWIFMHCLFSNISAAVCHEQQCCVFGKKDTPHTIACCTTSYNAKQ